MPDTDDGLARRQLERVLEAQERMRADISDLKTQVSTLMAMVGTLQIEIGRTNLRVYALEARVAEKIAAARDKPDDTHPKIH